MSTRALVLLLLVPVAFFSCRKAPKTTLPFRFTHSKVTLTVGYGELVVDGSYTFRNVTNQTFTTQFFLPFPPDSELERPNYVEVRGTVFTERDSGLYLDVHAPQGGEQTFEVNYRQGINGRRARYVLVHPQKWPEPIAEAVFIVRVSRLLRGIQVSHPTDRTYDDPVWHYYIFTKKFFVPTRDLVVTWQ